MPTELAPVGLPKHPLHALTTYELRDRRRELEHAIKGIGSDAPVQAVRRRQLDAVLAEQDDREAGPWLTPAARTTSAP
jgi:hypothetical protein